MMVWVTGGAGFIGANFLHRYVPSEPNIDWVCVDKLSYAGNLANLSGLESHSNYRFIQLDLADTAAVERAFDDRTPDVIVHFAAETHVDRSIKFPREFLDANVVATFNLLELCRTRWASFEGKRFHHVSTDEVFGSLGADGKFSETTPYDPSSPYSSTKAAADHLVRAYHRTYGLPVSLTNCSNNYGPYQYPEKLIPVMLFACAERRPLPVYGDGSNVRDWLYVVDHCEGVWLAATQGEVGETYCIGGFGERSNLEVVRAVCRCVSEETGAPLAELESLITSVPDRPGHDWRYAIDSTKVQRELGWKPSVGFEEGLRQTVRWYIRNPEWVEQVRSGSYRDWMKGHYGDGHG